MGRLIDKVAFDPGRINSAHQRADSWEGLYPDKGTPLTMRVTGLSLLGNLSLISVSGLCGALGSSQHSGAFLYTDSADQGP